MYLCSPVSMLPGHATRNDIVDDIVDVSSSTMAFNVAKIESARASLTISLTKSLRVAGPLQLHHVERSRSGVVTFLARHVTIWRDFNSCFQNTFWD